MFLTRNFLFVNRFFKFLLHILRQTRCLIVPRKYFFCIWTVVKYLQKPIITHYETDFSNMFYHIFENKESKKKKKRKKRKERKKET